MPPNFRTTHARCLFVLFYFFRVVAERRHQAEDAKREALATTSGLLTQLQAPASANTPQKVSIIGAGPVGVNLAFAVLNQVLGTVHAQYSCTIIFFLRILFRCVLSPLKEGVRSTVRPSVRRSIYPSVRPPILPFVRPSVLPSVYKRVETLRNAYFGLRLRTPLHSFMGNCMINVSKSGCSER